MRLIISCPDRPGIVAAVSGFLRDGGANIIRSDQYSSDPDDGTFFMRMELALSGERRPELGKRFGLAVADRFEMSWRLWDAAAPKRIAILVSRYDHCLQELLWRRRSDDLGGAEVTTVISNHPDLRAEAEAAGLPYHHVPVENGRKTAAEERLLELLAGECDLIVLARYMQILSAGFLDRVGVPVINIHHSFLPAFAGAGPYQKAKERGVKLVGATAHYVTEELDAGPIIEQDVMRVDHSNSAAELEHLGADIERAVLARAVRWHCEDRVLRHGNTTVVF